MSIFDSLKQAVGGGPGSGIESGLLGHAMNLVNDPEIGGLQGLIDKFHSNGLGGIVSSWISREANQAISPDQIKQVLGDEKIGAIASKLGISPDEASAKLSQLLPSVIDRLTPGGSVPTSS
jgi:uncharacterized protein YidB (DUF937 family)